MRLEDEMKLLKEKIELLEKIKGLEEMIDKYHTALFGQGGNTMDTGKHYNWFLIMCSWDWGTDKVALERFVEVFRYLNKRDKQAWEKVIADPDDPRHALDFDSLKALNLIGQRKFVIIGRTTSNRVLQELSSMITLETAIRVDVFPATYVREFAEINIDRLPGKDEQGLKNV